MSHDDRLPYPSYTALNPLLREHSGQRVIERLEREIRYLRYYSTEDSIAMADFGMTIDSLESP